MAPAAQPMADPESIDQRAGQAMASGQAAKAAKVASPILQPKRRRAEANRSAPAAAGDAVPMRIRGAPGG